MREILLSKRFKAFQSVSKRFKAFQSVSKRFKKDQKKAFRNPRQDTNELLHVIEILVTEGSLPDKYKPHLLSGNWDSKWECHIQPDFLLIYEVTDEYIKLERCGSHSELF